MSDADRSARLRTLLICIIATVIVLSAMILTLWLMGRSPIYKGGFVKLWHGVVLSDQNSQHISDWYTFSHIIHGMAFYGLFYLLARQRPIEIRCIAALLVECAWEIFENTSDVINHYREVTISLDYYGDSIINSVFDVVAMIVGFAAGRFLPWWVTVILIAVMEIGVGYMIRDNLILNIIMLLFPNDTIRHWQAGA